MQALLEARKIAQEESQKIAEEEAAAKDQEQRDIEAEKEE